MKKNIIAKKVASIILIGILTILININTAQATSTTKTNTTKTNTTSSSSKNNVNTTKSNDTVQNYISDAENTSMTAQEKIDNIVNSLSSNGLTKTNLSNAIDQYRELSKSYSNDEIADMLDNSKSKLNQENANTTNIDNINTILRNFNADQLNTILDKVNIDDTLNEVSSGSTLMDIVKKSTKDMSTKDKADLAVSIIWGTRIFHTVIITIIILEIYKIFIRCVIYKKAKRHAWAILIPVYRDVTMLKICGMSPWWLLLLFVPIIGWAILWVVHVASKFMLAEGFNKGSGFAFGLWLFWPIFESILAFSKKTKYIGIEK
jgi:hypothetical protein